MRIGKLMRKLAFIVISVSSVAACAGCSQYGKAPVGKAPVVAKY